MSAPVPSPDAARRRREQIRARVGAEAVPPPRMPMLWCVYYIRDHTSLALRAVGGELQFAEHDGKRPPEPGDIAFAAWGGPNGHVSRYAWPGGQTIAMLAFGRVAAATPNALTVHSPTVWREVTQQYLSTDLADRLHSSAMTASVRKPLLCASVAMPDVPAIAA